MITTETIEQKIAEVQAELDNYVLVANRQIAAYEGALQALKQLIEPIDKNKEKE